ncbi:MAG: hypothetical protein ABSD75_28070 [Terriglobales bacterium]|jgi:hypothetical protein
MWRSSAQAAGGQLCVDGLSKIAKETLAGYDAPGWTLPAVGQTTTLRVAKRLDGEA